MDAGFIRHGSVYVQRGLDADYVEAKRYLSADCNERRIFGKLEHGDGRTYRIVAGARNDDHFDPNTDTIVWDPYSALRTTRGGTQSPALGLAHEADHAVEPPRIADRLRAKALARYDDAEERRVIRGSEAHAARTLGEAQRYDHRGRCFRVSESDERRAFLPRIGA